ncbi:MAG: hypothetical protein COW47_01340 [Candidatus Huberarchaeum crystalense]|uniref:Uncharacterized protein n=1 Tax=Huberarchaeum crystalense TaxID=2014257 RepID=A0A2G9LJA8_HUBC1|nr:hypothetical protein [archaeon]OIP20804.1 MAG: hypothetical protein AUJ91_00310 [archaeon CG2_30_31_98]PIN66627.1 MAG: hypothetical protein COW69_01175 [Candidatus Huberarchaeum crystalense]NCS98502.1 hypothetical protein [archaeon]PIV13501.1 MAG: hypothetical protein COS45_02630 [Candidatus Huberarchaeum crystalense]
MIIPKMGSLFIDTAEYNEINLLFEKIKLELIGLNENLKKTENSVLLIKTINNEIKRSFTELETTKNKITEILQENEKA